MQKRSLRQAQRGFTLLEVMLVLSLMVIVTLVVGSNLRNGFRQQRLRTAADQVRREWSKGRNDAIKTGRVHVFYHTLQANRFFVVPQASYDDLPTDLMGNTGNVAGSGLGQPSRRPTSGRPFNSFPTMGGVDADMLGEVHQLELPQGVVFIAADVQIDQRSLVQLQQAIDPNAIARLDPRRDPPALGDDAWGTPVYFFPDGTTSTARLVLLNDRRQALPIYLRGLTGVVRIGKVQTIDDLANQQAGRRGARR